MKVRKKGYEEQVLWTGWNMKEVLDYQKRHHVSRRVSFVNERQQAPADLFVNHCFKPVGTFIIARNCDVYIENPDDYEVVQE